MRGLTVSGDEVQRLIDAAKKGDRSAFEELFSRERSRLEAFVRSRCGAKVRGRVEVEDIVQEAALRAFQSMERFSWKGDGSYGRWLCAIAEHLIWNVAQKRPTEELSLLRDVPASGTGPVQRLRRQERFDRLEEAMRLLKPAEREVLTLARIEGRKMDEIATRMGRTPAAVKMLLVRSLMKLRRTFGDTESLHLPDRALGPAEDDRGGH